jgi:ABC-type bacteriocin/lantibiotic exporter with double-glycine peptidase domain
MIEAASLARLKFIIMFAIAVMTAAIFQEMSSRLLRQSIFNDASEHIESRLLRQIVYAEKGLRNTISSGAFMARLTMTAAKAVDGALTSISGIFQGFFTILAGLIYMLWMEPAMAICFLAFNAVVRLAVRPFERSIERVSKEGVSIRNANAAFATEMLNNTVVIRICNRLPEFLQRYVERERIGQRNAFMGHILINGFSEIIWSTKKLAEILLPFGLGAVLITAGKMSFAEAVAFTVASDVFGKGFITFLDGIQAAKAAIPNIADVSDFLENEPACAAPHASAQQTAPALRFMDVSFSYNEHIVLNRVSFTIKEGEWVQLVGANGQGKSTILQLIAGFYTPKEGIIEHGRGPASGGICWIPQFHQIINATASENVALSTQPDKARCASLFDKLRINAPSEGDPDRFSQGEKQRLMIARALYHLQDKALVLGDEVFSNIDIENRRHAALLLQKVCVGKTMIMVCHNDMGMPFDRTLRVEDGRLWEVQAT